MHQETTPPSIPPLGLPIHLCMFVTIQWMCFHAIPFLVLLWQIEVQTAAKYKSQDCKDATKLALDRVVIRIRGRETVAAKVRSVRPLP